MQSDTIAFTPPPLSPYGVFTGDLFQYGRNRVAFESPPADASSTLLPNKCILLGGLSDGLIPVPYVSPLNDICQDTGWSLVQPILSSSYTGFGHGSLDRDVEEIQELVTYLTVHRNAERFVFIGHSTGCQDICHYLRNSNQSGAAINDDGNNNNIVGAVLQAPVSDREQVAACQPDAYQTNLVLAQSMVEAGQGQECMPRAAFWAPITAQRMVDLYAVGGADDYFSSDLSDAQLTERLAVPKEKWTGLQRILVAYSGSDEYIHPGLDTATHADRLVAACNAHRPGLANALHLPRANHNLSEGEVDMFIKAVKELLLQCKEK